MVNRILKIALAIGTCTLLQANSHYEKKLQQ